MSLKALQKQAKTCIDAKDFKGALKHIKEALKADKDAQMNHVCSLPSRVIRMIAASKSSPVSCFRDPCMRTGGT
jgi:predicted negative regulator of RcsB-dependent stress response